MTGIAETPWESHFQPALEKERDAVTMEELREAIIHWMAGLDHLGGEAAETAEEFRRVLIQASARLDDQGRETAELKALLEDKALWDKLRRDAPRTVLAAARSMLRWEDTEEALAQPGAKPAERLLQEIDLELARQAAGYTAAPVERPWCFAQPHRHPFEPETVLVRAGRFLMGSDHDSNEAPPHSVFLARYRIGRYPVTNREYAAFVSASSHRPPRTWEFARYPTSVRDHPVVGVSWYDARAYCRWLRAGTGRPYRLPTEAEWEKAASWDPSMRRPRRYPWGDEFDSQRCNTWEGGPHRTTAVGRYSRSGDSAYGVADMAGNVWEWCNTLYRPYPYHPRDGRESQDAPGPRVLRGGSWDYLRVLARCVSRLRREPDDFDDRMGFRVVVAPATS